MLHKVYCKQLTQLLLDFILFMYSHIYGLASQNKCFWFIPFLYDTVKGINISCINSLARKCMNQCVSQLTISTCTGCMQVHHLYITEYCANTMQSPDNIILKTKSSTSRKLYSYTFFPTGMQLMNYRIEPDITNLQSIEHF